jgi:DNA-binding CsgD family transcriptional regulator
MSRQDHRAAALETAVATLTKLLRPGATVFYRIGANLQPSGFELFGLAETMHRTWLQRYLVLDPMHPSRYQRQHGNVLTLAGELPEALRAQSVYWRRFLQPHRVVDVMEVLLRDEGKVAAAFSLLRFAPDLPFTQQEVDQADTLQPLLELALEPVLRSEAVMHMTAPVDDIDAPRLTHREEQIARLVRDGLSNKAIARDLELSQPTVKTHLLRMFRKLGVSSRTELIGALFL